MQNHRPEFHRLYHRGAPLDRAASLFGLTADEMGLALHYAKISKDMAAARAAAPRLNGNPISLVAAPDDRERVWCSQCDRRVFSTEADACEKKFCKAKALAA